MIKPYKNIETTSKYVIREFNKDVNPTELLWHQDLKSRKITILEGDGWYFQRDNQLPIELKKGINITIPAKEWHRIIKGNNNLKIKIEEK